MASVGITFSAQAASFLNAYVPGFAAASGGTDTLVLQVSDYPALPSQVMADLGDAGLQVPAVTGVAASGAPVAAGAEVGLAQFAPDGLAPQAHALDSPDLAAANAFLANLSASGAALTAFFEDAAAHPAPTDVAGIAPWASAQQQAFIDAFGIA